MTNLRKMELRIRPRQQKSLRNLRTIDRTEDRLARWLVSLDVSCNSLGVSDAHVLQVSQRVPCDLETRAEIPL